jgi:hypothetical protein
MDPTTVADAVTVPVDPSTFDMSGVIEGIRNVFQDFNAYWFLGLATLCYLVIQVLRGKAGFEIPYVTAWVEKLSKESKTYIILGLFAVAGVLTSLGVEKVTIWTILDGMFAGIAAGVGTIGTRNVVKQGIESVKALKASMTETKSSTPADKK